MTRIFSHAGPKRMARAFVILAAFVAALAPVGSSAAGPFEEATAAFDRGDYATALRIYRPLASAGMSVAQYNLALMYTKGLGTSRDPAEAAMWFRKAAEQGVAAARYALGSMLADGHGVEQDFAKAMEWFRAAADQGFVSAQYSVGYMHFLGRGVQQDYAEAAKWFRRAAEQGDANAQYGLGTLYSRGTGVSRNRVEAWRWFNLAIAGLTGVQRDAAVRSRDLEARSMTPQQLAEARLAAPQLARQLPPPGPAQPVRQATMRTAPGAP